MVRWASTRPQPQSEFPTKKIEVVVTEALVMHANFVIMLVCGSVHSVIVQSHNADWIGLEATMPASSGGGGTFCRKSAPTPEPTTAQIVSREICMHVSSTLPHTNSTPSRFVAVGIQWAKSELCTVSSL